MPNRNYCSGRNFEYRVKRELEQAGYHVVRKFASKGPYDLLAIGRSGHTDPYWGRRQGCSRVLLVQCKYCSGRLKASARKELIDVSGIADAIPVIAMAKRRRPILYQDARYIPEKPFSGIWLGACKAPIPIFGDERQTLLIGKKEEI